MSKRRRRRDDITVIGETDSKIMVRWNRPLSSNPRYAFRGGKVVRIDPRTGSPWEEREKGTRVKKLTLIGGAKYVARKS